MFLMPPHTVSFPHHSADSAAVGMSKATAGEPQPLVCWLPKAMLAMEKHRGVTGLPVRLHQQGNGAKRPPDVTTKPITLY